MKIPAKKPRAAPMRRRASNRSLRRHSIRPYSSSPPASESDETCQLGLTMNGLAGTLGTGASGSGSGAPFAPFGSWMDNIRDSLMNQAGKEKVSPPLSHGLEGSSKRVLAGIARAGNEQYVAGHQRKVGRLSADNLLDINGQRGAFWA